MESAKILFETLVGFKLPDSSGKTSQQRLIEYCRQVLGIEGLKNSRSLLKFDFSALPTDAVISAATLELYYYLYSASDPVGRTYWVYELTQTGWVRTEATWNSYKTGSAWVAVGGDYTVTNGASLVVPASYGWMSWNVLALVQHFQSTHAEVAHFLIKDGTEGASPTEIDYLTRLYSYLYTVDPTLCPKLVITYTTTTDLVVADGTQGQEVNNEVLTQTHNLAVASGEQTQAIDSVALTQLHYLVLADGLQSQAVDSVVLTQAHVLVVAGGTQTQAVDNITWIYDLIVASSLQAQIVNNIVLKGVGDLDIIILGNELVLEAWGAATDMITSWDKSVIEIAQGELVVEPWGSVAKPSTSWSKIITEIHGEE